MSEPILSLGELEPERHYIEVRRNAPDGVWQAFKFRHFDTLLRWFPVRFAWTTGQYPLRELSEFGLRSRAKFGRFSADATALAGQPATPAVLAALDDLLNRYCKLILDAPASVIEGLSVDQKAQLAQTFQAAVMGRKPTRTATGNPSTSAASSPSSTASTALETG